MTALLGKVALVTGAGAGIGRREQRGYELVFSRAAARRQSFAVVLRLP